MDLKKSLICATLICTAVSGCDRRLDTRGNFLEEDDIRTLKNSTMTKTQVSELLGRPTDVAAFSKDTWHYMGEVVQHRSFLTPKLIDRRIVIVKFNGEHVASVEQRGLDTAKNVIPVRRHTRTSGDKSNTLKEIFGNIGRIHKGNIQAAK